MRISAESASSIRRRFWKTLRAVAIAEMAERPSIFRFARGHRHEIRRFSLRATIGGKLCTGGDRSERQALYRAGARDDLRADGHYPHEEFSMKRIVLLACAAVLLATASVEAQTRTSRTSASSRNSRQGPVSRMLELERRKNEWIRRTFFNR